VRQQHGRAEIQTSSGATLTARVRDEILGLCDRAYGEDLHDSFRSFRDPIHVFATVEGAIVSHALWITRWLAPGDRSPLRTAYVEAVATDPAHEGHGFASAVMRRLLKEVAGFDLAALCPSDDGQRLYGRLGWETWRGPLAIRRGPEMIATPDESIMIHRLAGSPPLEPTEPLSAEWRPGELW
jgi:aminoglycoside 2'-N-acetyltransferase I